jgi:CDP-glucose 4,6-dehydratase
VESVGVVMFNNIYNGKKVVVTGHTGFKGSWLVTWLLKLGANVCGISDKIITNPSMFEVLAIESKIQHHLCDIRDMDRMKNIINDYEPDFIFHLAAQAIVSTSYEEPLDTISTNVLGTANVLEVIRTLPKKCVAVLITSDKCYENVEWEWGYKETDHVGGQDIYSGSKGAAEVIFHSYFKSFFEKSAYLSSIATGRAGNVIGGGDWAKDRIVVDCMTKWSRGERAEIRSPTATRPWQHVLEPLSGYLTLGQKMATNVNLSGESFNFGPRSEQNRTVLNLLQDLSDRWQFDDYKDAYEVTDNIPFHEAGLLKLNCDKALFHLNWEANLEYNTCVEYVADWYFSFYKEDEDMYDFTLKQISDYEKQAASKNLVWTRL